jgi:hypothetical protein
MIIQAKLLKRFKIKGICLFPFIFVADKNDKICINHEKIHFKQQVELFIIPFYIIYVYWSIKYGYWNNPFEIEAFNWQNEFDEYVLFRKKYNYFK